MKSTGTKKPCHPPRSNKVICANKGILTMSNLTQNFANQNNQPLIIGDYSIRQDEDGRYCINDLHKASGGAEKHKPFNFMRNQQTKDLIAEIEQENMMLKSEHHKSKAVNTVKGKGLSQGTFVVKELVYYYAMWISAKFHLTVIRAYDAMVMQTKVNSRQVITPEQKDTLQKIVDHKANGNDGLRPQIWTRHNRHFRINSYHELLAIHFEDAIKYLLEMEVKPKAEKQEVKALPYPQEVVQVAQQINQEYNQGRFKNWFISVRDNGVIGVQPLTNGYYPVNVAEFTKRFDGVLDYLYGSDLLMTGRHLQKNL